MAGRTASAKELKQLAADAVRGGRVEVKGRAVYLDGALVRVARFASALRTAAKSEGPLTLERFAREVKAIGREIHGPGRFGRSHVFISSLWDKAQRDPRLARFGEYGFKQELVSAHRAGLLSLSRADLTSAMNPDKVRASEVPYLNATFHFLDSRTT
jgi:hypothetical protein